LCALDNQGLGFISLLEISVETFNPLAPPGELSHYEYIDPHYAWEAAQG